MAEHQVSRSLTMPNKESAESSLLPEGMTKYDLKKKLQKVSSELIYETQRRKEALREIERQRGRIIKSLDAGCLRGTYAVA